MAGQVAVIGAGAVGLSTAVNIQRKIPGVRVTIYTDREIRDTTSTGAGGVFVPTLNQHPPDKFGRWIRDSFSHYSELANSDMSQDIGVYKVTGILVATPANLEKETDLMNTIYSFSRFTDKDLKFLPNKLRPGAHAYWATTLMMEGKFYLPYLQKIFLSNGGKIIRKHVADLNGLGDCYDVIVNCSGLGSRTLVNDSAVRPVRGQVMRVHGPHCKHFYLDWEDKNTTVYILPARDNVVMGGTQQMDSWDTVVRESDRDNIIRNCSTIIPSLSEPQIQKEWVGLRPYRIGGARVEPEIITTPRGPQKVVHNYGHAGDGVALSWGTAVEAAKYVADLVRPQLSSKL